MQGRGCGAWWSLCFSMRQARRHDEARVWGLPGLPAAGGEAVLAELSCSLCLKIPRVLPMQ